MPEITKEMLVDDLRKIGLLPGDTVYVHSSLKQVGRLENGPATLVEAFLEVLGAEGTLAVPTHTLSFVKFGKPPYVSETSPTYLGLFPETVRTYPGAFRSAHPTHSSAAIGANAELLTKNHSLHHALDIHSPLHHIYTQRGKVLLLGVTNTTNTAIHLAESLAELPYTKLHYDATWGADAHYLGQGEIKTVTQTEFPGCSDNFEKMDSIFHAKGLYQTGQVGNAASRLLEMAPMIACTIETLKKQPDFLLCSNPDCPCCPIRKNFLHTAQCSHDTEIQDA